MICGPVPGAAAAFSSAGTSRTVDATSSQNCARDCSRSVHARRCITSRMLFEQPLLAWMPNAAHLPDHASSRRRLARLHACPPLESDTRNAQNPCIAAPAADLRWSQTRGCMLLRRAFSVLGLALRASRRRTRAWTSGEKKTSTSSVCPRPSSDMAAPRRRPRRRRRDHVRGAGCRNPSRLFHAPRAWGVLSPWRRATPGIAALFFAIRVLLCQDAWGRMWLPRPPTPSNASAHL